MGELNLSIFNYANDYKYFYNDFHRTIYHFDPSNPPTTSCAKKHHISTSQANNSRQQKYEKQKSPIKDYNRKFPASSFEHEDQVNTVPEKTSKHNTDTGNNQQTFYENKHQEDPEPDETPNTPEIVQESSSPDPSQNSNLSNGSSKDSKNLSFIEHIFFFAIA